MNQLDISLNMEHLTRSKFKSFLLLLFLFIGFSSYGQQPAEAITKADKSKRQAISREKLDLNSVRKNTPGTTLDISKDLVKKERQKSDAEKVVYGPEQPDKQGSPLEALKDKKEDLGKRDMSSKHFINDDGTYTALVGGGPIHYDRNGTWEDISHTITPNNNQQYPYSNTTNLLESYFGATAHLGVMSKTKEGEVKEFLNTTMYWEVNDQPVNIQNSNNVTATIDGDKAYYNNLFGTIAAEYSILSGKRKLNYIIPNAQAFGNTPINAEYLVFSEDIVLPTGWIHCVDKKKGILIKDASGTTIYAYENPTVYEDYNGELSMPEKDNPASFEIKKIGNTITLFLKVKTAWLQDTDRVFPLAIDPTVNVYPNNATFWTGWVDSDGNGNNNAMRVGHSNTGAEIDAFMKFNLSTIPVGSTVTTVTSHLYRNSGNGTISINHMMTIGGSNVDPVTAPSWVAIYNSYTGDVSVLASANNNGWKVNTFDATGITFIENALVNGFASLVAWPSSTAWTNNNYADFHGYSHANRPYLSITYTAPAGPCIPSISAAYHPPANYIRQVSFIGTLEDVSNTSTFSNPTQGGYQDFTGLATKARQAQGEGVNIYVETVQSGFYKAWVDWNNDNVFSAGESVYDVGGIAQSSTTFGFVIPPETPPGDYKIRIRMSGRNSGSAGDAGFNWGPCGNLNYHGETEDYLFTVEPYCDATITSVTDGETCGESAVDLSVTGSAGTTEYRWYTTETGGTPITTTTTGNWTTPIINATTVYYVTAYNGSCESWVRTEVTATYNPVPTVTFNPASPIVCGEDEIIQLTAEGDTEKVYLIDENFNSGLGIFTNTNIINNGNTINTISSWQNRTSTFKPTQQTWYPAISSGFGPNKFVMATSDVGTSTTHNQIMSPNVNATDFLNLTLELRMYHSRYYVNNINPTLEFVTIDVSTDNGATWIEIERLLRDVGIGTKFEKLEYDLSAYINQANLRVRVRYYGEWCDGLAIDDVKLYGDKPLNTAFTYNTAIVDAFTDAAATIPYTSGTPITTIYIKPTLAQLESSSFTIPVSATLSNGCAATGTTVVTNNTKIYKSAFNDWNDDANWSPPGVPTIDNCVIIPNGQTSIVDGTLIHAEAQNVTVKNGGVLHLEPEYTLTVQDWINVENTGVFNIKNSASLIQINDLTTKPNSGNIHVQRAPKANFSSVGNLNYVYWSSPVKNFNVRHISPNTSANLIWKWIPTISGNGSGDHGDWQNATGTMLDGTGYIVRGLSGAPTVLPATSIPVSNNTALFTGVPNNGEIVVPINRGNYTADVYSGNGNTATAQDDNWNLLGNPYPSSISANAFVNLNTHISGTLYLWPHTALPSAANDDPFYGNYGLNYNNIYIEHNPTGTIPPSVGDLNIASGQAFMVLMMDSPSGLSESVLFNNNLRDRSQANDGFYRLENTTAEKHRIWLDFSGSDNKAHTLLVGYIENATNEYDRLYDGYNFVNNPTNFYSLIDESTFSIQGRAWPFLTADTVPLGFTITTSDIYKIGINSLDGLFDNDSQDIFLEDIYLGTIHNLRSAPYSFNSGPGSFNDRFVLRYTNDALSIPEEIVLNGLLISAPKNNYIKVVSSKDLIKTIEVYDILGRVLFTNKNIQQSEVSITELKTDAGTFIVKVTLSNGLQKTQKVVLK